MLLVGFASIKLSTASESMILDLPDLGWSLRFLQAEPNFFNHLVTIIWSRMCISALYHIVDHSIVTIFTFYPTNIFDCFRDVKLQFKVVKHKFENVYIGLKQEI